MNSEHDNAQYWCVEEQIQHFNEENSTVTDTGHYTPIIYGYSSSTWQEKTPRFLMYVNVQCDWIQISINNKMSPLK